MGISLEICLFIYFIRFKLFTFRNILLKNMKCEALIYNNLSKD